MLHIDATNFQENIFSMLQNTIRYNEPVSISTKDGNAVLVSEEKYRGMEETLRLLSSPVMKEKILTGKNTPLSDCLPEGKISI